MSPVNGPVDAIDRTVSVLSEREQGIGHLWAAGLEALEIAASLRLSPETVHLVRRAIYEKLGISSREELRAKFAQGTRPPARTPRTAPELALFLAISDAERESPEEGERVQKLWSSNGFARERQDYLGRARTLLEYLEVLPTPSVLDS